eukprot:Skav223232  [mRNA]  locus=scaffold2231:234151:236782:- [translate_table: standard]
MRLPRRSIMSGGSRGRSPPAQFAFNTAASASAAAKSSSSRLGALKRRSSSVSSRSAAPGKKPKAGEPMILFFGEARLSSLNLLKAELDVPKWSPCPGESGCSAWSEAGAEWGTATCSSDGKTTFSEG